MGTTYLGNTMRLIDGDKTHTARNMLHLIDEAFVVESLWGAIYDMQSTGLQLLTDTL